MIYYEMLIAIYCLAELFVFFAKNVVQEYHVKSVENLSISADLNPNHPWGCKFSTLQSLLQNQAEAFIIYLFCLFTRILFSNVDL